MRYDALQLSCRLKRVLLKEWREFKMKIKDLREKSVDELKSLELELLTKLYNKKNEARAAKKMEKSHEIKSMKKTRSQILTLITELEMSN